MSTIENAFLQTLTNPLRARLLLEIHARGQASAKQLAEKFTDIPLPTLYRHLKKMHDGGVLLVIEKKPVRGAVEKVYAVASDFEVDARAMLENNDGEAYLQLFTQFMLGVSSEFREYTARPNIDLLRDGSGFTVAPIYATTAELTELITSIGRLIMPLYNQTPDSGRKLHNICIITTPPKAETPTEASAAASEAAAPATSATPATPATPPEVPQQKESTP